MRNNNGIVYALTDYKNRFGSKWKADPYRSGYDKILLQEYFQKYGYVLRFKTFRDLQIQRRKWQNKVILYSSSEERIGDYRSYIQDIVLGLENIGAIVIPSFEFLRAHDNKVYMEFIKEKYLGPELTNTRTQSFGTLQELQVSITNKNITFPCVIKDHSGAQSKRVYKASNETELLQKAKRLSRTHKVLYETKDVFRTYKHKGYKRESGFQNKFIVQDFIPNLHNDWKILVYGNHYYILNRGIKENDFRASGSHHDYKAGSNSQFPVQMLDIVETIYHKLDIPHLSLDFAYDGKKHYVFEIQAIYFGTSTLDFSDDYYTKGKDNWVVKKQEFDQEEEYIWGLVHYFNRHPELFKRDINGGNN